jgi:putative aldouronate transport system substrate-binding protein
MTTRRFALVSLMLTLTVALFATGTQPQAAGQEVLPMRWVVPGSAPQEFDVGIQAVNEELKRDGVPIEFSEIYVGFDQWENKTNVMLASGEPFELLNVMDNSYVSTQQYAVRGATIPLDKLIDDYGPGLWDRVPDILWQGASYDGKVYSFPVTRKTLRHNPILHGEIGVRADLLQRLGVGFPTSVEELVSTGLKIQDLIRQDTGETAYMWDHTMSNTPNWLHRTYDSYPFYVDFTTELFYVDWDGNVKAWIETPEFEQDARFYRDVYQRGLIHPDILSAPQQQRNDAAVAGKVVYGLGGNLNLSTMNNPAFLENVPGSRVDQFYLNADFPILINILVENSNAVPVTTENPEAAVMFMDWLYGDQHNHDLLLFGIEGRHFEIVDDHQMKWITGPNGSPLYQTSSWMIARREFIRYPLGNDQRYLERTLSPLRDDEYILAPTVGFFFDPTPVITEYNNLMAERPAQIYPLKLGVVDFDDYYPQALKRMKDAGLDAVIAEYRRQFNAWRENQ